MEQTSPAVVGRLETPVRPVAWWRLSVLQECAPCVTTQPDEAQQWRDEGHDVRELGDVGAERKRVKDIVTRAALTQAPLGEEDWQSPEAAFQAAVKSMAFDVLLRIDGRKPSDEQQLPLLDGPNVRGNAHLTAAQEVEHEPK